MLSGIVGKAKVGWWVVVTTVILLFIVACGGPQTDESNNQGQSSTDASSGQAANNQQQASSNSGSTASNQSPQGASGSGGQSGQSSAITGVDACASFSWLAQTGTAGFSSQWGDGYRVDASKSPPSEFAAEVAKFAEESLEEVLDGDVSAECFYESKAANYGGVYVALGLPGDPPSGLASSVGEAMKKRGGNVLGAYSSNSAEGTFDFVSLQTIPVEPPAGGTATTGALYFITTQEGVFQAVMLANYTDIGSQGASGGSSIPAAPSSPQMPAQERTVTAVVPSGTAGSINDELEPALEKALGVDLVVENFFQTSSGGNETVLITYFIKGDFSAGTDLSKGISEVVEDLDGNVTFAFAASEGTTVAFEGVKAGGLTIDGGATHSAANSQLAVTITSVSGG